MKIKIKIASAPKSNRWSGHENLPAKVVLEEGVAAEDAQTILTALAVVLSALAGVEVEDDPDLGRTGGLEEGNVSNPDDHPPVSAASAGVRTAMVAQEIVAEALQEQTHTGPMTARRDARAVVSALADQGLLQEP